MTSWLKCNYNIFLWLAVEIVIPRQALPRIRPRVIRIRAWDRCAAQSRPLARTHAQANELAGTRQALPRPSANSCVDMKQLLAASPFAAQAWGSPPPAPAPPRWGHHYTQGKTSSESRFFKSKYAFAINYVFTLAVALLPTPGSLLNVRRKLFLSA